MKVLITNKIHPIAEQIFQKRKIKYDVRLDMSAIKLKSIINNYDGLLIRSSTKITRDILKSTSNLKVVGVAGIGVDNVDLEACKERGVVVMNTPFGNTTSTAEHTIALLMAIARNITYANDLTKQGKWPKIKSIGFQLEGKTLGVVGCGNVGSQVVKKGVGLGMKVVSFDPFLTDEKAKEFGIKKVSLNALYKKSDFITYNVPLNDKTRGMLNKEAISKMKDGILIVNCARGGIMIEDDIVEAIGDGKIAGFATDVYIEEPVKDSPLFKYDNVICTPHIGAQTHQAQINVAKQSAEQICDYLLDGKLKNRV